MREVYLIEGFSGCIVQALSEQQEVLGGGGQGEEAVPPADEEAEEGEPQLGGPQPGGQSVRLHVVDGDERLRVGLAQVSSIFHTYQ